MNVLSLFDGMSCGRIALERAGVPVTNYFASEIDPYAIKVSKANWPDIVQLGDVTKLYGGYFTEKIDLLIGGSPCQGFSSAGNRLNFDDHRSKLFFEYVRILKEIKPTYFLLENVKMPKLLLNIISEYLGVRPVLINSSTVSAQNRERYYWTNIDYSPMLWSNQENISHIVGFNSEIPDILEVINELKKYTKRVFNVSISKTGKIRPYQLDTKKSGISEIGTLPNPMDKCSTITASHAPRTYKSNPFELYELNVKECEQIQTVPVGYTKSVSERQAKKILGNGWTVDVITNILSGLKNSLYSDDEMMPQIGFKNTTLKNIPK